ncbi:MAG: WD40 repeat domain-containing protein, partial [Planctomycetota bacterium]
LSLEEGLPAKRRRPVEQIAGQTLAQYIAGRPRRPGAPSSVVLLFDQFEEILTLDPIDVEAKQEFFRQLGETLKNPDLWALFALREDYLAPLDPYRDDVPTRLSNTFRIDLLSVDAGLEAITQPAHDAGLEFADEAARKLVDDLATVSVQQPDGSFRQVPGRYVEPVQLQVVCRRLWDELPAEVPTIGVEHLQASGDVDAALAAYYDGCIADIAHADAPYQRRLREWFSERLITPGGIRGQVLSGQDQSGGLDNALVRRLLDTHLVRAEQRAGATWYELAHDRLVAPVRTSNAAWLEKNLHPMQRQAALWEREGKPERLLLRTRDLIEAEGWARANRASVLPIEKDLLVRSVTQRRAARIKLGTMAFIICGLLGGLVVFRQLYIETADAKKIANAGRLASLAVNRLNHDLDLALLLSVQANLTASTIETRNGLADALAHSTRLIRFLHGHTDRVRGVAFSPANPSLLVSSGDDSTIRFWDLTTREPGVVLGDAKDVPKIAFNPSGTLLASASDGKTVGLRDIANVPERESVRVPLQGHKDRVFDVEFSPADGELLASASDDGTVRLWNVEKRIPIPRGNPLGGLDGGHRQVVQKVAFSPDGRLLASASRDQTVILWDVASGKRQGTLRGHGENKPENGGSDFGYVEGVAFSPTDGTLLVSAGRDRTIRFWDVGAKPPGLLGVPLQDTAPVMDVAFSPDGAFLASSNYAGTLRLWDVETHQTVGEPLIGHSGSVRGVAFSPDGKRLASASDDRT